MVTHDLNVAAHREPGRVDARRRDRRRRGAGPDDVRDADVTVMSRFRELLVGRVDRAHGAQDPHVADHARADRRRRGDGRRGRADRVGQGRPEGEARAARHEPDHRAGGRHVRLAEPDASRRRRAPRPGGADGAARRRPSPRSTACWRSRARAARSTTRRSRCRCWPPTRLPEVLEVPMDSGRWLRAGDGHNATRAAVLGAGLAHEYGVLPGEIRIDPAQRHRLRRRRRARAVALDPNLDNAVFVTQWAAKHDFDTEGKPNKLYVRSARVRRRRPPTRSRPRSTSAGPTRSRPRSRATCSQASAQADKTLQQTALFAGLLALAVGGLGIANVMSISVIQRSSEIGIRRALGHSRSKIALQFLLESLFVGILGGLLGAVLGVGIVYLVSAFADWVVVIDYGRMPLWIGLAVDRLGGRRARTRRSRPPASNRSRPCASADTRLASSPGPSATDALDGLPAPFFVPETCRRVSIPGGSVRRRGESRTRGTPQRRRGPCATHC